MNKHIRRNIIPYVYLILCFIFAVFFLCQKYYVLMNSDTSSELLLGKILAQNGGILSNEWFYSTELRVLNTQIIYKLVYMVVGDNWFLYRIISNIIHFILLAASYIFMTNSLGIKKAGIWTAGMILLPFSPVYGYIIDYGAFYVPHFVLMFLSLGFMFRFTKDTSKKRKTAYAVILIIIGFGSGLGGVRQAMICYVPAFIASLLLFYLRIKNSGTTSILELNILTSSIINLLGFFPGFVVNKIFLSKTYSYVNQSSYLWESLTLEKLGHVLSGFLKACGIHNDVAILGPLGIVNAVVLSLIVLIIVTIQSANKNANTDPVQKYYIFFVNTTFIVTTIILSCGDIMLYNLHYWVPVIPLFFPFFGLLASEKESENTPNKVVNILSIAYISLALLLMATATYKYPIDPSEESMADRSEYLPCRDFLIQSGYTEGFAPFWLGNQLVELCNGKIDIWVESDEKMKAVDSTDSVYRFLQSVDHASNLPRSKFFIATYGKVIDDPEYGIDCPLFLSDDFMIYSDDYVTLYGFNSLEEYRTHLESLQ